MPLDLADLQARRAKVAVEYAGATLHVTYRPEKLDLTVRAKLLRTEDDPEGAAIADLLAYLIAGWDLTEGGEPLPPSAEALRRLSIPLLGAIANGIVLDAMAAGTPGKNGGSPSPATS